MASGPITTWEINKEKKWKQWQILFSWDLKSLQMMTVAMKLLLRHLCLERKAMTNIDGVLRSWDITLLTKVHTVKTMFFPVVMYGCESWTNKDEGQKTDALKLWCWRRLLRIPCIVRRSNQSTQRKSTLNIHWKDWHWNWHSNNLAI